MRAETQALKVLLDAGQLAGLVHVGQAPADTSPPYLVLEPQRNSDEQARLSGPRSRETIQIAVRSVGETLDQAGWIDEHVDRACRPNGWGVRLTVPGRSCSPLDRRATDAGPDDSAHRVWEVITSYRFTSSPA